MAPARTDGVETVSVLVQEAMNTSILGPLADEEGGGLYGYMFTFEGRRLLFVRNLGAGVESVAQLVRDAESGEALVRKVNARRLVHHADANRTGALKKPTEIRVLDALRRIFIVNNAPLPPSPLQHHWIVDCYGHEYIESTGGNAAGRDWAMYHSVSYWKLCNGQSVGTHWVTQGALPPTAIVGRMARQVLSTLQFLYTAGPRPLYHRDAHLGNVWIHWPSASSANPANHDDDKGDDAAALPLPDFYLGDFGEAAFDDDLSAAENPRNNSPGDVDVPVADLSKFNKGLRALLAVAKMRRRGGEEDEWPGYRALEGLGGAVTEEVERWSQGAVVAAAAAATTARNQALPRPPDLAGLIQRAGAIENEFGRGGTSDETRSAAYARYVAEECRRAAALEREGPLVVSGSRREALKPSRWRKRVRRMRCMMQGEGDDEEEEEMRQPEEGEEMEEVLMRIHGPWRLVKAVGGDWVPVEDQWVTHHRPNGGSAAGIADYELSETVRPPNPLSPMVLEREGESPARELPLLSFSFAPGDEVCGRDLRPPTKKSPPEDEGGMKEEEGVVIVNKSSPEPVPLVQGRVNRWLAAVYGRAWYDHRRRLEQDEEALLKADPRVMETEKRVQRAIAGVKEARFNFDDPFDFELL